MNETKSKIKKFAQLILDAKNIVALTGADMRCESRIHDSRSLGTSLWEKFNPDGFSSIGEDFTLVVSLVEDEFKKVIDRIQLQYDYFKNDYYKK